MKAALLLLALVACASAARPRGLLTWQPGQVMDALNQRMDALQQRLSDVLGVDWQSYTPAALQGLVSRLGDQFSYESNLQEFMDMDYSQPTSMADLQEKVEKVESIFCKPETFIPSEKVFATCVGPAVKLSYVPKVCVLDEATKSILCEPAKIMLSKIPGGCTKKYATASSWKSKECRISGKAGFSTELTYGGGEFPLSMESMPWAGWLSGFGSDPNAP